MPEIRGKTRVIYNPPPQLSAINKKISEEPILIYAGGVSYIKGFTFFLDAIVKVLRKPKIRVYAIYGKEAPLKEKFLLEKVSQSIDRKLIYLGRLPHKEYLRLHEKAWALLFPSLCEEPLPYAVVESLLLKTIPIASRIGGISEILSKTPVGQFIFSPNNIEEFADRIEKILSMSREEITNIGIMLKDYSAKLFEKGEIERKFLNVMKSLNS